MPDPQKCKGEFLAGSRRRHVDLSPSRRRVRGGDTRPRRIGHLVSASIETGIDPNYSALLPVLVGVSWRSVSDLFPIGLSVLPATWTRRLFRDGIMSIGKFEPARWVKYSLLVLFCPTLGGGLACNFFTLCRIQDTRPSLSSLQSTKPPKGNRCRVLLFLCFFGGDRLLALP